MRPYMFAALAAALLCGTAWGQRPEQLDRALRERYGEELTTEIVGTPTTLNNVRVYNVRITGPEGESHAVVTEYGDFMLGGVPREFERLPEPVRNVQTLLRADPRDAEAFIADGYYIDVEPAEGQIYRLRFDPIGRLRDVANPQEVERYETTTFEEAPRDTARRIELQSRGMVERDAELRGVFIDPRFEGFYVAKYQGRTGEVLVIMDEQGNVYQTRTEIPRDQLPSPVADAFRRMFDEGRLRYAYRTQYEFFTFRQEGPEGEQVTFRVRPTGAIMDIRGLETEAQREDEAVTARYREAEQDAPREPDRDRERDRDDDRRPPLVPGRPPVGPQQQPR